MNRSIQSEMDKMPDVYTKNLLMKNISMVEYMDFMDSYHCFERGVVAEPERAEASI